MHTPAYTRPQLHPQPCTCPFALQPGAPREHTTSRARSGRSTVQRHPRALWPGRGRIPPPGASGPRDERPAGTCVCGARAPPAWERTSCRERTTPGRGRSGSKQCSRCAPNREIGRPPPGGRPLTARTPRSAPMPGGPPSRRAPSSPRHPIAAERGTTEPRPFRAARPAPPPQDLQSPEVAPAA